MDPTYFLKARTEFIRFYYSESTKPFLATKHAIENQLPPFNDPPYSEDEEPAFLESWTDANTATKIAGMFCISLLSDTLKLYFQAIQHRVVGFSFEDEKSAFKRGFVPAYLGVLGPILRTDWSDCPANLATIEQVVLARNQAQHGSHIYSFDIDHNSKTLEKYPRPFFADEEECRLLAERSGEAPSMFMPALEVTADSLFSAIDNTQALAIWIDSRLQHAYEWRMGSLRQ